MVATATAAFSALLGLYSAFLRSLLEGTPSLGCLVCVALTAATAFSCSKGYT